VHVGQFFFDDEVNVEVDKVNICVHLFVAASKSAKFHVYALQIYPYSKNPIAHTFGRTRNWDDFNNIFDDAWGPEGKYNPIFKMHLLGGIINQGLIGYITMVSFL
jgi:hypothetical protein